MATLKKQEKLKKVEEELKKKDESLKEQKVETKKARDIAKKAALSLKNETRKQTTTAIIAAFGFLIALVWRDAIKGYVDYIIEEISFQGPSLVVPVYTAVITTIIAVIGIIFVNKWNAKHITENKEINVLM